ncbi:MAG: hypothetical protein HC871_03800 [Rhizobiales bacterium]|nr:hypothetical protein [Hyphomicrobiales bacterium]
MRSLALLWFTGDSSPALARSRLVIELEESISRKFDWITVLKMRDGNMATLSMDEYVALLLGSDDRSKSAKERLADVEAHLREWTAANREELINAGVGLSVENLIEGSGRGLDLLREGNDGGDPRRKDDGKSAEPWFPQAVEDLGEIDQESSMEGWVPVSATAKSNARKLLEKLKKVALPSPSVYSTEDREVGIFFVRKDIASSFLVLCNSDGGAGCYTFGSGRTKSMFSSNAEEIPSSFMFDELARLVD